MTETTKELIRENVRGLKPDKLLDHKIKDRNILIRDLRSHAQVMFDILTDGTPNKQIPLETLNFWRKQLKIE
jgi:hypothetical protein